MTEQAQVYNLLFYIGIGLGAAAFILSIILFFKLRIPKVIGDLTGSTARKVTNQIQRESESGGQRIKKNQMQIYNIEDLPSGNETIPLEQPEYAGSGSSPTVDLAEADVPLSGMKIEEDITIVSSDVIV